MDKPINHTMRGDRALGFPCAIAGVLLLSATCAWSQTVPSLTQSGGIFTLTVPYLEYGTGSSKQAFGARFNTSSLNAFTLDTGSVVSVSAISNPVDAASIAVYSGGYRLSVPYLEYSGGGTATAYGGDWVTADLKTFNVEWSSVREVSLHIAASTDLDSTTKKEYAMQIVSSAENSSTLWRAQYAYIEDIHDGRGYTAGIIGFCSGTGDMLELVQDYSKNFPSNGLAKYLPALRSVNGSSSHVGLDPGFPADWAKEAGVPAFQAAQDKERDDVYFNPSVAQGKADGLHALGQFAYYEAAVVHGFDGMMGVRTRAMNRALTPAQGGDETVYLNAFLDERVVEMKKEPAHADVSRIETAQRVWLRAGNLDLNAPLAWKVYGDPYSIPQCDTPVVDQGPSLRCVGNSVQP